MKRRSASAASTKRQSKAPSGGARQKKGRLAKQERRRGRARRRRNLSRRARKSRTTGGSNLECKICIRRPCCQPRSRRQGTGWDCGRQRTRPLQMRYQVSHKSPRRRFRRWQTEGHWRTNPDGKPSMRRPHFDWRRFAAGSQNTRLHHCSSTCPARTRYRRQGRTRTFLQGRT